MTLPPLPPLPHADHLAAVRDLANLGADEVLFVGDLLNVRYLTGFTGSAGWLLVGATDATLLTDERYAEQAAAQSDAAYVSVVAVPPSSQLSALAAAVGASRTVLFDPEHVTVSLYDRLAASLTLERRGGVPEAARRRKGPAEVARIRLAGALAVAAHAAVVASLGDEPTERELADRFAAAVRAGGADGIAFSTIVAVGERASMPHAEPTDRRVREGEVLLMDFGAAVDGYLSDVTRTIAVGSAPAGVSSLLAAVTAAHDAGVALMRPGVTHAEVDAECRRVLAGHGLEGGPTHPFGHHLGLFIHERPFLAAGSDEPLRVSDVVTVEPGFYRPGVAGCRVEDTVLVTADGPDVLTAGF